MTAPEQLKIDRSFVFELEELGCEFAQGCLLARPLEPAAVEALLTAL